MGDVEDTAPFRFSLKPIYTERFILIENITSYMAHLKGLLNRMTFVHSARNLLSTETAGPSARAGRELTTVCGHDSEISIHFIGSCFQPMTRA
jgi:hypothetical protein